MAHVLVTGAAGFIGSHTVEKLLAAGHRVTGVDNLRTGRRENLAAALRHTSFAWRELDIATAAGVQTAVGDARPDVILHLAALVSVPESMTNPDLNYTLNVAATHLLAEAARVHQVRRVVFASSAAVYGLAQSEGPLREEGPARPISPYGAAKLASEALLLGHGAAYGFAVRCQRYFNVFGPRQDPRSSYSGVISIFAQRYAEGKPVTFFGDGQQTRDFISVHDVARANVLAATLPDLRSGVVNICTGRATSLREMEAVFRARQPAAPAPEFRPERPGDVRHSLGSPAAAQRELGFTAEVDVRAGLEELLDLTVQ